MKKLSLNQNAFSKGEVLTRAQLKKVMGGDGSTGSGGPCFPVTQQTCFNCCMSGRGPEYITYCQQQCPGS